jgi:coenzyme F420-0:L-glutamate ligase/coenzyme F420-1:gamma-L-glutamate ligase
VDFSNVPGSSVTLLPEDPDRTAGAIRNFIREHLKVDIAVLICDSQGRPFRMGSVGVALGYAGLAGLVSRIEDEDLYHYRLQHTQIAVADQVASSALLVMGETNEGVPAAIVRGLDLSHKRGTGQELIRPADEDLFR